MNNNATTPHKYTTDNDNNERKQRTKQQPSAQTTSTNTQHTEQPFNVVQNDHALLTLVRVFKHLGQLAALAALGRVEEQVRADELDEGEATVQRRLWCDTR